MHVRLKCFLYNIQSINTAADNILQSCCAVMYTSAEKEAALYVLKSETLLSLWNNRPRVPFGACERTIQARSYRHSALHPYGSKCW